MELAIIITFTYIIPMILTAVVIYHKSNEVTRGDLVGILLVAAVPLFNLVAGYVGVLVVLCESKTINDFFNKRIK